MPPDKVYLAFWLTMLVFLALLGFLILRHRLLEARRKHRLRETVRQTDALLRGQSKSE